MVNKHNKSPMNIREGNIFVDGVEVTDSTACTINFTPEVWTGKQLNEKSPSTRWIGYTISGSITQWRSTPWIKEVIAKYKRTGVTPEVTIQGRNNDTGSDYFATNGAETTTVVGVVFTGDLPLTRLDSSGDIVKDVINFVAKDIV
jgi:NAD-dependent DNA ligase